MRKRFMFFWLVYAILIVWGISEVRASEVTEVRDSISDILTVNPSADECMVYNAYQESRSESDISNLMVMASVVNRVASDRWGGEVCEVVLQKSQYSWVRDGLSDFPHEKGQFYRMNSLLDFFWKNLDTILEMSQGADHYHHKNIKPAWDWSKLEFIGQFDNHLFYRHK